MQIIFHGAAKQVGRSCIELKTNNKRFLLDCGIRFTKDGFEYPEGVFDIKQLDGVLISHAHLDHTGALPFFEHKKLRCPIFMTPQTKVLTKILLADSYKIANIKNLHPAFDKTDLKEVQKDIRSVEMDKEYSFQQIKFSYHNAGHIPGSASILIKSEGKRILYSADVNSRESLLIHRADATQYKDIDVLITEATYGARELPERELLGKNFLDRIEATIKQGGRVLIPVFAVGRAQEVLIALSEREWPVPIYFEGMCKQVTRKILVTPSRFVKNKDKLHEMYFERIKFVKDQEMREEIVHKPGIFVCTSGMMQGGPATLYLRHLYQDEKSAVLLTGYQVQETTGWWLSERKEVRIPGVQAKAKCYVERFDFSGHLSKKDLHEFISTINPKVLLINHGNEEAVNALKAWVEENTDIVVYDPELKDCINIEGEKGSITSEIIRSGESVNDSNNIGDQE